MLRQDSIAEVKSSILMGIRNELIQAYPVEFGDYEDCNGTCSKIFWGDTISFQPKYPYCMLSTDQDSLGGYDDVSYVKREGEIYKKYIKHCSIIVQIEIVNMANIKQGITQLEADVFAHKVARQLRSYFNCEDKLEWFEGNEYYPNQISSQVEGKITPIPDWSDTDTKFRYNFDIEFGWDDISYVHVDKGKGFLLKINKDEVIQYFKIGDKT